jgi:hypothetical protein
MKNFFANLPPDAKIRFLPVENYGFPQIVSIDEAKRIANWDDVKCPMCEAGIPLKKGK